LAWDEWEGSRNKQARALIAKLERMDKCHQNENGDYVWAGTLDEFADEYGDKFIVMGYTIAVTQYNHFGQRG
jgi:hypothetical protein